MENNDDFRVKRIKKMLLEMAKGNFFYTLEPSDKNDNIASLVVMLNMVSEEIRAAFIHQGFANAHTTPQCIIQLSLILNDSGQIELVTNGTCSLLSYLPKDLIGKPITEFMTEKSKEKWTKKLSKHLKRERSETVLFLEFMTNDGLILAKDCQLSVYQALDGSGQKILLNTVFFSKGEPFETGLPKKTLKVTKGTKEHKVTLTPKDIQIIRGVHDAIINNLDKDLPSLKELAHQEGTNEYKLKYGFKQVYGTTIFRFLIQERLRMARTLILHSTHTIKQIVQMTGFKSKTHFSRAFKDKYGRSPSEFRS
ncbi:MAG: helix-turn-helix domain-containing protein [Muricauda sp.]|jgi:AraC-like DNA-binding protein|nr:helix-turn-helix domain-containing protein [Allomuricauda sp.]MBO6531945.1 helix-turn-helix domain-containing protein [Allomuricauda sp.]MBO6588589.1 helix-turn-helix domain-containing protein [Allomuricauda sp.]MBO6618272.1 helix-turn-helix domain-containing protein [Allomuricauda sp.]MBO6644127.1 helix-turn-helix domain-containing protein [Allomuricauda sp.]MBO6747011.1 helix-turn-helix domain-containing protein [Allomuricauda sp.]